MVGVASCAAVILARRISREPAARARLGRAARAHGVKLSAGAAEPWLSVLALATQRCASCAHPQRCEEILAAGDPQALRAICRNTEYFGTLQWEERRIY